MVRKELVALLHYPRGFGPFGGIRTEREMTAVKTEAGGALL